MGGTPLARGIPFREWDNTPNTAPTYKTRWGEEELPLPGALDPNKTGQDRGMAAQGRGCHGQEWVEGVPAYLDVRVLWLPHRDQHLRWHRVEGTASGEDREDLPWGSRLPQWCPQGTGGYRGTQHTPRGGQASRHPHPVVLLGACSPLAPQKRLYFTLLPSLTGARPGRSWCQWMERACRMSPTSGLWTSSARPIATKPRSPWSWWCGWLQSPQSDAAPPLRGAIPRSGGAGWLIPAPSCGWSQHRQSAREPESPHGHRGDACSRTQCGGAMLARWEGDK